MGAEQGLAVAEDFAGQGVGEAEKNRSVQKGNVGKQDPQNRLKEGSSVTLTDSISSRANDGLLLSLPTARAPCRITGLPATLDSRQVRKEVVGAVMDWTVSPKGSLKS